MQSILLEDAQIPHEAKDKLSSFIEGDYDSIVSKSFMDIGRTHVFSNGYSNNRMTHSMRTIPNPAKISKVHQQGNKVNGKYRMHMYKFQPMAFPDFEKLRPFKSSKTAALLSLRLPVTQ